MRHLSLPLPKQTQKGPYHKRSTFNLPVIPFSFVAPIFAIKPLHDSLQGIPRDRILAIGTHRSSPIAIHIAGISVAIVAVGERLLLLHRTSCSGAGVRGMIHGQEKVESLRDGAETVLYARCRGAVFVPVRAHGVVMGQSAEWRMWDDKVGCRACGLDCVLG